MTKNIQKKIEKLYRKAKQGDPTISSHLPLVKIEDIEEFDDKVGDLSYDDSENNLVLFKKSSKSIYYFGSLNKKDFKEDIKDDYEEIDLKPKPIEQIISEIAYHPEIKSDNNEIKNWLIKANNLLKQMSDEFAEEIDTLHERLDKIGDKLKEQEEIIKTIPETFINLINPMRKKLNMAEVRIKK